MTAGSPEWRRGAVWSGAQLGIYRDLGDEEGGATSRGRRDAWRLRCCLATAGVALAALLVSIALVDVAGSRSLVHVQRHDSQTAGSPARRTQGAPATAVGARPTGGAPGVGSGMPADASPVASTTTTTTTTTSTPAADTPVERSGAVLLRRSPHQWPKHALRRFRDGRSNEFPCSGDCGEARQFLNPPEQPLQEYSTNYKSKLRTGFHRQDVRFPESASGGDALQYAQLAGYKFSGGPNSIQDVIRYLTEDQPDTRPHHPKQQNRGRLRQHVRFPAGDSSHPKTVRFSGVYSMPRPAGERYEMTFPGNEPETGSSNGRLTVTLPPPPLNGHAYVADPFVNFRPEDPSQINLLANSGLRFALPARSLDKISQFQFPTPPPPLPGRQPTQTQLYTEVVYHPLGQKPAPHTQQLHNVRGATRPFSVMLDVYPLTAEGQMQYRPPPPRPRPAGASSHMVVHLNLYPRNNAGGGRRDPHDRSDEVDYAEAEPTQEGADSWKQNVAGDNTAEMFASSPVVFCNKTMDVFLRVKDVDRSPESNLRGNGNDRKEGTDRRQGPSSEDSLPLDPREASSEISGDQQNNDHETDRDEGRFAATGQDSSLEDEEGGSPTNGHRSHGGSDDSESSGDYDMALDDGPPRADDYVSAVGYFGALESSFETRSGDDLREESELDGSAVTQVTSPHAANGIDDSPRVHELQLSKKTGL